MLDNESNLLTSDQAIQDRAVNVYKERLTGNTIEEHLVEHERDVNKLCETRLELAKLKKTDP